MRGGGWAANLQRSALRRWSLDTGSSSRRARAVSRIPTGVCTAGQPSCWSPSLLGGVRGGCSAEPQNEKSGARGSEPTPLSAHPIRPYSHPVRRLVESSPRRDYGSNLACWDGPSDPPTPRDSSAALTPAYRLLLQHNGSPSETRVTCSKTCFSDIKNTYPFRTRNRRTRRRRIEKGPCTVAKAAAGQGGHMHKPRVSPHHSRIRPLPVRERICRRRDGLVGDDDISPSQDGDQILKSRKPSMKSTFEIMGGRKDAISRTR